MEYETVRVGISHMIQNGDNSGVYLAIHHQWRWELSCDNHVAIDDERVNIAEQVERGYIAGNGWVLAVQEVIFNH